MTSLESTAVAEMSRRSPVEFPATLGQPNRSFVRA
jgi:hypothetical protein